MNVATLPDERAISDPDAPCLSDEGGQLDNTVFASRVRAVAGWRVGAVLTPLNPGLTAEEANYQLADSKARLTVVDAASIAKIDRSVSLVAAVDELSTLGASNELPP